MFGMVNNYGRYESETGTGGRRIGDECFNLKVPDAARKNSNWILHKT